MRSVILLLPFSGLGLGLGLVVWYYWVDTLIS